MTKPDSNSASEANPDVNNKQRKLIAGAMSGLVQSLLFNPWDRALYLSVKNDHRFLAPANWRTPFAGCTQSLTHRAFSSGMYWPLVDTFLPVATRLTSPGGSQPEGEGEGRPRLAALLAGNAAGAVNGLALNWLSAAKYRMWGQHEPLTFAPTVRAMWREGGCRPFLVGIVPTVLRDAVFGGAFMVVRTALAAHVREYEHKHGHGRRPRSGGGAEAKTRVEAAESSRTTSVAISLVSGSVATLASAPFNFARNMQYATPPSQCAEPTVALVATLFRQACAERSPARFLQRRLRVGWGTMRVAVGMAAGFELYSCFLGIIEGKSGVGTDGLQ